MRDESAELNTPLCFTALEAGSTFRLGNYSSTTVEKSIPTGISLEYSRDNIIWQNWDFSAITLPYVGSKAYIRATSTNEKISTSTSDFNMFSMTGKIAASGNIVSLIDKTMQ